MTGGSHADPDHPGHAGDAGGGLAVAAEEPGVVRKIRAERHADRLLDGGDVGLGQQLHIPETRLISGAKSMDCGEH